MLGSRSVYLVGCFVFGSFVLACGLARTSLELILFRGFQGIAVALCLPTTISILTETFPNGRTRNTGFSCIGAANPLGFALGLLLGGFFVDSIGWRCGWYLASAMSFAVLAVSIWGLPHTHRPTAPSWRRLVTEVDWIGAILASACLGMLSYVLA